MSTEGFFNVHAFSGATTVQARPSSVEHPDCVRFMLADLARSGLLPADIDAYPVAPDRGMAQYAIPYPQDGMYRIKRDDPKFKYKGPQGRNEVWFSSKQVYSSFRSAPVLLIVEGEKKAARAVKEWPGIPVLAIGGVWNGSHKQADGTHRLHDTILNAVAPGQKIKIIFDNDILEKPDLQKAAFTLYTLLERQSCRPELWVPPSNLETKGLDDYLVYLTQTKRAPSSVEEVGLVRVPFEELTPTRAALIDELNLDTSSEGAISITATNYARLFKKFIGPGVKYDARLGFTQPSGRPVDIGSIKLKFIQYIESTLKLKYVAQFIDLAVAMFVDDVTTDVLMDEIRSVQWDGVPRLETWGNEYIKNVHGFPQLSNEWGRLLMTGLGLRLLEPGTKFDLVMYLVGSQGTYKTSFFEKLATFKCGRFYGTIEKVSTDDSAKRTLGARVARNIILDFSESSVLDGRATSIETLKSFITLTEDEFRKNYSNDLTQQPRSFVFVGTSNKHNQLYDTTGSRRFSMLDVKDVVTPLSYDVKMQILAEVFATAPQIKKTDWWEPRLTWDSVPEHVMENIERMGFVPNPNLSEGSQINESLNLGHIKQDPNITDFKLMLESADEFLPTHPEEPDKFLVTRHFLEHEFNISKRDAATLLGRLKDDPHFPWAIDDTNASVRLSSLMFPKNANPSMFTRGPMIVSAVWFMRRS